MYAQPSNGENDGISEQVISPFVDMGFPRDKVISTLTSLGIKEFNSDNRTAEENRIMEALLSS